MVHLNPNDCYFNENGSLVILVGNEFGVGWATLGGFINPIAYDKRVIQAYLNNAKWDEIKDIVMSHTNPTNEYMLHSRWKHRGLIARRIPRNIPFYVYEDDGVEMVVLENEFAIIN